jgi:hypothetical protein
LFSHFWSHESSYHSSHSFLSVHERESLATLLPSGQEQAPPSRDGRQEPSHPREAHRLFAAMGEHQEEVEEKV